jgi:hypothetical protein
MAACERFSGLRSAEIDGRKALWKLPQLWKSNKDAFGDFFLMISISRLEKSAQKTLRLFHSYHSAGGGLVSYILKQSGGSKHNISSTPLRHSGCTLATRDAPLQLQMHACNAGFILATRDARLQRGIHPCNSRCALATRDASLQNELHTTSRLF